MRQRDYDRYKQQIEDEWKQVDNELTAQIQANSENCRSRLALLDQIRNGSKRKAITRKVTKKVPAKPVAEPTSPREQAEPKLPLEGEE